MNYISLYTISGMSGMYVIKSLPVILRVSGIEVEFIGWFLYIALIPWVIKAFYSYLIERYRQKSPANARRIVIFANIFIIAILILISLNDSIHFIFLGLLGFLIQVAISSADIALSAMAIDNLTTKRYSSINSLRVIFGALGAVIGSGAFLILFDSFNWLIANLFIAVCVLVLAIPSFFLKNIPIACKQKNKSQAFKNISRLKEIILLIIVGNLGVRLAMGMVGIFLVDKKFSLESLGLIFGAYSVIISIFGGIIGVWADKKLGSKNLVILALAIEIFLFVCYIYQSFIEVEKFYLITLFLASVMLFNLKIIPLYSLAMKYAKGDQSGIDFSLIQSSEACLMVFAVLSGGYIIKMVGYGYFFSICLGLSLIGFIIWTTRVKIIQTPNDLANESH